ncbi:MAG: hypothetical protein QM535_13410 [Limnohabitans sp.]|nr:hypothetical protein [Limnohabitans sp.]
MLNKILSIFFKKTELELFKKIELNNVEDLEAWKYPNILAPLFVVGISLICYPFLKEESQRTFIGFTNLLFNGSLALFSINRLGSVNLNLFRYNRTNEEKLDTNTKNTRIKLNYLCSGLVILLTIFYVIQVNKSPFEFSLWLLLQSTLSTLAIYLAINFSKFSYLLQDKLLDNAFADKIREDVKENKIHLQEKYSN